MPETTEALLRQFGAAWNRHDIEGLLALVTEDCVFETAAGPTAHGAIFAGKDALRVAFPAAWTTWPDARWEEAVHVVAGTRAFSEWTFRGTDRSGVAVEVRGVDLFEIRDGLIARKDTYRKLRTG
ncbi:MAG: nuclear transport factor 2 family protein [Roseococcus sp.]